MFYLVYAESLHYAGFGEYFVVEADSALEAQLAVEPVAETYFYEQDYDQFAEEYGAEEADEESFSNIVSVEEFDEFHKDWKFKEEFTHV